MSNTKSAESLRESDIGHVLHGLIDQNEFPKLGSRIFESGYGIKLRDISGKEYIDARSGAMSVNIGYGNEELAEVARSQMIKLAFQPSFAGCASTPEIELASRLAGLTPPGLQRFMFFCGGSEANDTAIKIARFYWQANGKKKYKIISMDKSYHGATYGALSVSGKPGYSTHFGPLVPGFLHIISPFCYRCPLGKCYPGCGIACAGALEDAIDREGEDTVAAFLSECMMAGAGYMIPPPEYWPMVMDICKKHNVLLIIDEVITGFGRTGKFFACEHFSIKPDIMTMSKGLASSYMPMAGVALSEEVYRGIKESGASFPHVHTFGGHPVGCAVALKNIDIMLRDKLVENAVKMGVYLEGRLDNLMEESPYIGAVRGRGLWFGVELVSDKDTRTPFPPEKQVQQTIIDKMLEKGVIVGGFAPEVIGIGPPLIINKEELDRVIDALEWAVKGIDSQ